MGIKYKKGKNEGGNDEDYFINKEAYETLVTEKAVKHKHKITPYIGHKLRGNIIETYLKGAKISKVPQGIEIDRLEILRKEIKIGTV